MEQTSPLPASSGWNPQPTEAQDLALAGRAAAGDDDAYAQLYERHKDAVYAAALRVLRDAAEAADILQDTFLLLIEGRRGTPPRTSVRGWLLRVASNLAIDRLRQRRVRSGRGGDLPTAPDRASSDPGPEGMAQRAEVARAVEAAVGDLSPKLRIVVVLRYAAGLSYEEVAEALECSIGTVKSRLARAHARLAAPLARLRPSPPPRAPGGEE